jgi:lia operon protein LiaG
MKLSGFQNVTETNDATRFTDNVWRNLATGNLKNGGVMRSKYFCLLFAFLFLAMLSVVATAYERIETYTFEDVHSIDVQTVSGNIMIMPGHQSKVMVELINDLDDPEQLDPEVKAKHGELFIEENFHGRNIRGETHWTIYLPEDIELRSVECSNASGEIILERFKADYIETESASGRISVDSLEAKEIEISTASGAIIIEDCQADEIDAESASGRVSVYSVRAEELSLSTASGKITLEDCKADFVKAGSASGKISFDSIEAIEVDLSNASGKIVLEKGEIERFADVSSASGDVEIYLARLPSEQIDASTASGDLVLNVPEFGKNFTMTLVKRADRGRIKCPFDYTHKETIRLHRYDDYLTDRFLVEKGSGGPEIQLSTASGSIKVKTDREGI